MMKLRGLLVGLGIGAVVGLLAAPKKGSELVEDITKKVEEVKNAAKDLKKEDVITKFNDAKAAVEDAIKNFDADKFKEATKEKLEALAAEIEKLKTQVTESEQFNNLVNTFSKVADAVNEKVEEIVEEIEDVPESLDEEAVEDDIDETAKEIEDLIKEMNADCEEE